MGGEGGKSKSTEFLQFKRTLIGSKVDRIGTDLAIR